MIQKRLKSALPGTFGLLLALSGNGYGQAPIQRSAYHDSRIPARACGRDLEARFAQTAMSRIFPALEQGSYLIMVAQERHKEIARSILKDKPQREGASALEEFVAELANTEAAVRVRPSEAFHQVAQGGQALGFLGLRKFPKTSQHL